MKTIIAALVADGAPVVETILGDGKPGSGGDGGLAVGAQVNNPFGIATGPDGALYVCEVGGHRIRRIGPAQGLRIVQARLSQAVSLLLKPESGTAHFRVRDEAFRRHSHEPFLVFSHSEIPNFVK